MSKFNEAEMTSLFSAWLAQGSDLTRVEMAAALGCSVSKLTRLLDGGRPEGWEMREESRPTMSKSYPMWESGAHTRFYVYGPSRSTLRAEIVRLRAEVKQ